MAKQVDSSNLGSLLQDLLTRIKNAFWRKSETSQLAIDNVPTSGSNNLVKSGGVYSAIPDVSQFITRSVNDLANYYLKTETYTKDEVAALIGAIQQFHYEIVATLPATGEGNVLYLVGPTGSGSDRYEEYVYANNQFTKIGDTSIDLSGYVTTTALNTALAAYTTSADLATLLAGKADKSDTYTKQQVDNALAGKQDTINDLADIRSGSQGNVKYTQQSLSDAQKAQARSNIGAAADKTLILSDVPAEGDYDIPGGGVWPYGDANELEDAFQGKYDFVYIYKEGYYDDVSGTNYFDEYTLSPIILRTNPDDGSGALYFEVLNTLSAKTFICYIDRGPTGYITVWYADSVPTDVVKYTAQSLNDSQKAQARSNIGAGTYSKPSSGIPASDLEAGVIPTIPTEVFIVTYGTTTQAQIKAAVTAGQLPICKYGDNLYVYAGESSADYSQFTSVLYDTASRIYVKGSTWGNGEFDIYSKPSGGIPNSDLEGKFAGSPSAGGAAFKAMGIPFGEVDSTSTATEITATVDNFPETLTDGVCAYIRNDVIASASGWTLDINGTGAKPVYQSLADASRVTTLFSAASTHLFIYNSSRVEGGCWDLFYGYNSNDNTIGYILRTNYMSMPVTSACYRYRLLFTSANGQSLVPANASSSTNATAARTTTQTPIDPFGSIRYYNYTTAVTSGNRPGATYLCEQYQVTLGYSFNRTGAALTLTPWDPVYIKCAPQSDGSAIIDADTPYVQALPSTADGKIYIYLGVATSATQVEVVFHHPVYYYKDGAIRLWTNPEVTKSYVDGIVGDIETLLAQI